jgi:hypothetical protein
VILDSQFQNKALLSAKVVNQSDGIIVAIDQVELKKSNYATAASSPALQPSRTLRSLNQGEK